VDPRRFLDTVRMRLRALVRRRRVEADLEDELQFHLEHQIAEHVARGLSHEQARTLALRQLGGYQSQLELCRDSRGVNRVDHLQRDIHAAGRLLLRNPGFAVVALLSLALGIGANATIFGLVNAVRLRPLPVAEAGRLAIVDIANRTIVPDSYSSRVAHFTSPLLDALQAHREPFGGVLAWSHATMDLSIHGESNFVENGLYVSGSFFEVLGVRASHGRTLTAADDTAGCSTSAVVLSDAFWRREYGGATSVLGTAITLNAKPFTIVGVTPPGFYGVEVGRAFDLAIPLCAEAILNPGSERRTNRGLWWLGVMGRLKPGWSLDRASSYLSAASPAILQSTLPPEFGAEDAAKYRGFRLAASPGASGFSQLRERTGGSLLVLMSVAGVVLLIACANLANLLLARMSVRDREMAVRLAIGASRGRLIQQLLVESLMLAAVGTLAGALLAPSLGRVIVSLISSDVDPMFVDLAADWRVIGFLAALGVLTTLSFGLAPALRASRVPPGSVMKSAGRGLVGGGGSGVRRLLAGGQVGLSLVLLVIGLLFMRSLVNLLTTDAGFTPAGIVEVDVDMRPANLPGPARAVMRDALVSRLRAAPGVAHVATVASVPLVANWWRSVYLPNDGGWKRAMGRFNRVSPGYFDTLGTRMLQGRDFDAAADVPAAPRVAIVNEAFVRRFLGGVAPIGLEFRPEGATTGEPGPTTVRIIGLVADTKHGSLREAFDPIVYVAESQVAEPSPFLNIFIRPRASGPAVIDQVRSVIPQLDGRIAFHFHDVGRIRLESIAQDRLMAVLCGAFAVLGGLLAVVGVYGVMAYTLTRRRAEIGVRLALGAGRPAILRMAIGEAAVVVGAGVAAGTAAAIATARLAESLLYGLTPLDPSTFAVAIGTLSGVAMIAAYLPANRASRTDPTIALRHD
jgi:predicted permease